MHAFRHGAHALRVPNGRHVERVSVVADGNSALKNGQQVKRTYVTGPVGEPFGAQGLAEPSSAYAKSGFVCSQRPNIVHVPAARPHPWRDQPFQSLSARGECLGKLLPPTDMLVDPRKLLASDRGRELGHPEIEAHK